VIHSSSQKEKGTAEDFIFLTIGNGKEGIKCMRPLAGKMKLNIISQWVFSKTIFCFVNDIPRLYGLNSSRYIYL